jgi:L-lactate dehydrogenase
MKVGIIGSGLVGATTAYAMVMRGVGREIVMVDVNRERARAEADDVLHAVPFASPIDVYAGDYPELKDSQVVVITAGANQKPGETRLQLLGRNASIIRQIAPNILRYAPEAVLLVASNPVDVLTHMVARVAKEQGIPSGRVLGSGTTLDTARFRALLGRQFGIDAQHIHAYVVGEHGDSEVLTWSRVSIGGLPLNEFCQVQGLEICQSLKDEIDHQVRGAAYSIIEGKGASYYGIGSALTRIVEVILKDQRAILTVCTPQQVVAGVQNVTLSLPQLVGGQGIISSFPLPLDQREQALLQQSAGVVRKVLDDLNTEEHS